jgi:uncharacterized peroxidase-related enzyme
VQAHATDLRAEVEKEWNTLSVTEMPDDAGLDSFVHQIVDDWRAAPLSNAVRTLVEYAEQVTREPRACAEEDIRRLRDAGWCDASIHDAVQVIAYFNYINRVADALGVEVEQDLPHWGSATPA